MAEISFLLLDLCYLPSDRLVQNCMNLQSRKLFSSTNSRSMASFVTPFVNFIHVLKNSHVTTNF